MANPTLASRAIDQVDQHRGWYFALGLTFIVMGGLVIAMPIVTRIALTVLIGLPLVVAGSFQLLHAYQTRNTPGAILRVVSSVAVLLGGVAVLSFPIVAALTLSTALVSMFAVTGVMQLLLGLNYRPRTGWQWFVAAGVVALVVALMILLSWPISGFLVPSLLVGLSFVLSGWSYVSLAFGLRPSSN